MIGGDASCVFQTRLKLSRVEGYQGAVPSLFLLGGWEEDGMNAFLA